MTKEQLINFFMNEWPDDTRIMISSLNGGMYDIAAVQQFPCDGKACIVFSNIPYEKDGYERD